MVQVILGNKGSGKTLKLIQMTNDALKVEKGNIFFIDSHNRHMYDLHRDIRFVNASEYGVDSAEMFYGMLCGMISANFDITLIVVDGLMKMLPSDVTPDKMENFFDRVAKLSDEHGVRLVIGMSGDPDTLPEFVTRYAIEA
ncbi:MAG: hypothetical protein IJ048_14500 [Clostridia bacterium]|nr:hypothetical protein [Clostridia bacterium]